MSITTRARQMFLAVTTLATLCREDWATLTVHATRRAPARVMSTLARIVRLGARPFTVRAVLADLMTGQRTQARAALPFARAIARTGFARTLLSEFAVDLDLDVSLPCERPTTNAREAARRGHLTDALNIAPAGSRLASELAAQKHLLDPATTVPTPPARTVHPAGLRALHYLTNSLPHTPSGYAVRSHQVLTAQRHAGVEVAAATRLGYPVNVGRFAAAGVERVEEIDYHRLLPLTPGKTSTERLSTSARMLVPLVRHFRPGVLHTTTHYTNALVTAAVADATGLPWVYEVRGQLEQTWASNRPTVELQDAARASEKYTLWRAREAQVAAGANAVVTLNDTMRADLIARGVPAQRITVIPNSVNADLLTRNTAPARARVRLGLPQAGFWVGTLTSVVPYEGIEVLVRAVQQARAVGANVKALIVGDGVSLPDVTALVDSLGLREHVALPGRVPVTDVAAWYEALDAFVVPRLDTPVTRMVTPLKPMDAMALGRPVIASDLPALAEVVASADGGKLVAPGDPYTLAAAMVHLEGDRDLAGRLGASAREFAAGRTWAAAGRAYRDLYESLGGER